MKTVMIEDFFRVPPVSTTPAANFATSFTSIVDTGVNDQF